MGRNGVSYLDVAKTASELQSVGLNPTVDNIRERLKTGSRSTIGPYLKQWRDKHEEIKNIEGLPSELFLLVKGLYDRIHETANEKIDLSDKAARQEISGIQEKLDQSYRQKKDLENAIQALNNKIHELTVANNEQKVNFENEQKHTANLTAKTQELELRLKDKTEHSLLLEKQLNQVQANLEHYREEVHIQRENERKTRERETNLLNKEITALKNQNIEYNNSIKFLNQKILTIQEEKLRFEKDWLEQRGKTMELQEQLKMADPL